MQTLIIEYICWPQNLKQRAVVVAVVVEQFSLLIMVSNASLVLILVPPSLNPLCYPLITYMISIVICQYMPLQSEI